MKRIALLPVAVSVLSTFLVACGSGYSETPSQMNQDSAPDRRTSGEQWGKQERQKKRSEFDARRGQDPMLSRISSAPIANGKNSNQSAAAQSAFGMSMMSEKSDKSSSSGDLLKMGAVGLAVMALTQGFDGKKVASALGLGNSGKDEKNTAAPETEPTDINSAPRVLIIDEKGAAVQTQIPLGTKGNQEASTLSVNSKDAREKDSVKTEETRTTTDTVDATQKRADEQSAGSLAANGSADQNGNRKAQEGVLNKIDSPSQYKIVFYDQADIEDCMPSYETNASLVSEIKEILANPSEKSLGGIQ